MECYGIDTVGRQQRRITGRKGIIYRAEVQKRAIGKGMFENKVQWHFMKVPCLNPLILF